MAVKNTAYLPPGLTGSELRADRTCFGGLILNILAYGALLMVYVQLSQALLTRPKRGRSFWFIVAYATTLFPLATFATGGLISFSVTSYIDNRNYPGGVEAFQEAFLSDPANLLGKICFVLLPIVADLLMFSRLYVLWRRYWMLLPIPGLIHIAKSAVSIVAFVERIQHPDITASADYNLYITVYLALSVVFNIIVSTAVWIRVTIARRGLHTVMGNLSASYYTSISTCTVESGALITFWSIVALALQVRNSAIKHVFLAPYPMLLCICRLIILLRIARSQAWSRELISAAEGGVLDWQVSSTHSLPLRELQNHSAQSIPNKELMHKLSDTTISP